MKILSMFFIALLLIGCGANWHLKQANRHLRRAEQLGAQVSRDTVYKTVEVIKQSIHGDTVINYLRKSLFTDTIRLQIAPKAVGRALEKPIKIKLKIDTIHHTVYVQAQCPPDTIKIKVPVSVTKIKPTKAYYWSWILIALLGFLIGYKVKQIL